MFFRSLAIVTWVFLGLTACKKMEGSQNGCTAGSFSCNTPGNQKTQSALLGKWKSKDFTETGSVKYFQRMLISKNQIRFSQVCSKNGGATLSATVYFNVIIDDSKIQIPVGTEREEFSSGISCRIKVYPGEWAYQNTNGVLSLDLITPDRAQTLQFVPEP